MDGQGSGAPSEADPNGRARQTPTELSSQSSPVMDYTKPQPAGQQHATTPPSGGGIGVNKPMIVLWILVAVCVAAVVIAIHIVLAKAHANSPF